MSSTRRISVAVAVTCLIVVSTATPQGASSRPDVAAFIEDMVGKHGFDRAALERDFAAISFQQRIVGLMDQQAKPKPWPEYRSVFVNPSKIRRGLRFWEQHASELRLASERYGVPEEIIVAILGIETNYGRNTGRFKVLEALTTLAFDYPKRAELFRQELEHFLLLAREESLPLRGPLGSYAGAMGIAQFLPGSYRRYAIDFDGDGKRDLFENRTDAIGSVANYLTAYGWQRDAPIAVPARVGPEASEVFARATLATRVTLEQLQRDGVELTGAFASDEEVIPLALRIEGGSEHWVGFSNFYVITRYNRSVYYAMAVFQLGRELRDASERAEAGDRN